MKLIGIIMTSKQQEQFDRWSKLNIYMSYLEEVKVRKKLNEELNKVRLELAAVKYNLKRISVL